jgi:hypothetical protein
MALSLAYPQILVDGHDITTGARAYCLEQVVGELPVLTVELFPSNAAASVEAAAAYAAVKVGPTTRAALVALGWTPPPE